MSRPQTPFEAVSYELNQFRERRMKERRAVPRSGLDRRVAANEEPTAESAKRNPAPAVIPPSVSD